MTDNRPITVADLEQFMAAVKEVVIEAHAALSAEVVRLGHLLAEHKADTAIHLDPDADEAARAVLRRFTAQAAEQLAEQMAVRLAPFDGDKPN